MRNNFTLNEVQEKEVKSLKVGKDLHAVIKQSGSKFAIYINGELLDKGYSSVKEAEKAAKEFADLIGA